ncbi:hypothetical protein D8B26_001908 [Coccidioides posadasii str. Silveira]|nr:hypothetical protein D8B26_001908 [Coccidioides posadasii str. Silveira]
MDQRDSGEVASSTVSCSNSLLLHYICTTIKSLHATIRNFHPQYSVSKISSTGNLHLRIMSQGSSPLFSSQALFRTFPYGISWGRGRYSVAPASVPDSVKLLAGFVVPGNDVSRTLGDSRLVVVSSRLVQRRRQIQPSIT